MNINLSLKTIYFDAINRGVKTTEYRDMTAYYVEKLVDKTKYKGKTNEEIIEELRKGAKLHPLPIESVTFFNNGRVLRKEVKGIEVQPHHTTFAIKLGKRID